MFWNKSLLHFYNPPFSVHNINEQFHYTNPSFSCNTLCMKQPFSPIFGKKELPYLAVPSPLSLLN